MKQGFMVLSKSNHSTANSRCKGLRRNLYTLLSRPTEVTTSSGMEDSVTLWAWTLFGLFIPSSVFKIDLPPCYLPPPSLLPSFPSSLLSPLPHFPLSSFLLFSFPCFFYSCVLISVLFIDWQCFCWYKPQANFAGLSCSSWGPRL